MELQQLKYYAAVVQAGTINGGARLLGMTQPPVSMQIRLLEEELGCTLFERGSRSIRLTEEGRLFYDHAVRILDMAKGAAAAVSDCRSAETGTLRIGVVSSLAAAAAEKWFSGFSAQYPGVDFAVYEGNTYLSLEKLKSRILDAALVRTPFSSRGFLCISLEPEDMLLTGVEKFLGGLSEPVSLADAAGLPLIVYRRWADVLDRAFSAAGFRPRIICTADDARTCISWAKAGIGAAIAPAGIAADCVEPLMTRTIFGLAPAAAATLVTNEGGCDTAVGRRFAEYWKACCGR